MSDPCASASRTELAVPPAERARLQPGYTHLTADFLGVPVAQLRDLSLLSGLLIASAGAAGISALGAPRMQTLPNERVAGWLQLDDCHIAVYTFPDRELLLLDVLSEDTRDTRKAFDVFARRIAAREVRSDQRHRG